MLELILKTLTLLAFQDTETFFETLETVPGSVSQREAKFTICFPSKRVAVYKKQLRYLRDLQILTGHDTKHLIWRRELAKKALHP